MVKKTKHCVKHKSHITKVMFLYAAARPRFNTSLNAWWDGKLGIWPIGDWEPAQRKLKNRPKGMPVWKNKIVTKEVYRDLLITKLIPAIMERWPVSDRNSRKIFIQQDGAKNHIHEDDKLFNAALEENRVNTELYTQSANSPDVNLLDLGFFRAIQSFNDASLRNEEELIKRVWVGWGLWPLIVPIGVDVFLLLFALFPPHLGEWVGFFGAFVCFSCVFWSIGVCVEGGFLP